jgi:hypothetical protein
MNRPHFIGLFVTKTLKERIQREARNQRRSVSSYMYLLLLDVYAMPDDSNPSLENLVNPPPDDQKKLPFEE